MTNLGLKKLSAAIILSVGAQGAQALTPWANGAPDATVYISGGAAQDPAFGQTIRGLAVPGSLDVFGDATNAAATNFGARWTAYYFTGQAPLASGANGLAGKKILVVKRSLGAAGYGVLPLINPAGPIPIQELNIFNPLVVDPVANPGNGITSIEPAGNPGTVPGATNNYRVIVTAANGGSLAPKKVSNAGILGVDARLLLKQPVTHNYPVPVPTVPANYEGGDSWPTTVDETALNGFTRPGTGGLVYGVAVNTTFFNVLQEAQRRAGILPSDTVIGSVAAYQEEKRVPTLSRNFVGSLIAGKINTWDQVKIVDKTVTPNVVRSLTDATILSSAGVSAGNNNLPTKFGQGAFNGQVPVAVGNRNAGAAIGAIGYAVFLNWPWTNGAFPPATGATNAANELTGNVAPIVKLPGGAAATGNLLDDWDNGTNVSTLNPNNARRWGIALNSADRNVSKAVGVLPEGPGRQNYRYIRIDGYLPSVKNVASGNYPHWAEGELIYKAGLDAPNPAGANTVNDVPTQDLLNRIASGLGSASTAATTNQELETTWGQTGIFGLTNDPSNPGNVQSIPYSDANPVVPYTHKNGANVLGEIVPTAHNTTGGVLLQ